MKTGKQLLLSEQNLLDCAWDYGNTGCLGGFQPLAFNYMHDVREIASEEVRDISMWHQDDRPQKSSLLQGSMPSTICMMCWRLPPRRLLYHAYPFQATCMQEHGTCI